jgi:ubiquinone/menaquinone biosynthesis C-methylase UbiE
MISTRKSAFVCLVISVALAACASSQHGGDDPDAWEARHNAYQPPEKVLDAMGVKPGMLVAEVGAGRGRYVVHVAARVGDTGMVYANDIDEDALEYLRFRCERDGIGNVETLLGEVTDPLLPEGKMDIVYVINTYHHFDKPVELMRNILPALKPDGLLVIVEHDPNKMPDAGPQSTTPQDELLDQAEKAGYELVRIETFLERDNINIFRRAGSGDVQ